MTYAIQELVIRDVAPVDTGEITDLVTEAMWDGRVARWLNPDPVGRRRDSPGYFGIFVEHAVRFGEVYATADAETGRLSGVALWFPRITPIPPPWDYDRRVEEVAAQTREWDRAAEPHRPADPHHHLAVLAVHPDDQGRGIGTALLDRHHARLDEVGIPAYLEADHPRNRDLFLRHGYRVRSVIALPDGPSLWSMWRLPMN